MILDWKNDCFIWMWFHSSYPILMNWDVIPIPYHLQYWYQMNSCIEEWYFCCLESNVSGLCDCWWIILNNTWWNEVMSYQIINWFETNVNDSHCSWDFLIVYIRRMMKEPLNVVIRMIGLNVLRWMVIMIWWMYLLICVVLECIEIEMKIWWFWYWYDIW